MSDDPKTKPAEPPAIDLQGSDKVPAVWAPRFQIAAKDGIARITFGEVTADGVAHRGRDAVGQHDRAQRCGRDAQKTDGASPMPALEINALTVEVSDLAGTTSVSCRHPHPSGRGSVRLQLSWAKVDQNSPKFQAAVQMLKRSVLHLLGQSWAEVAAATPWAIEPDDRPVQVAHMTERDLGLA